MMGLMGKPKIHRSQKAGGGQEGWRKAGCKGFYKKGAENYRGMRTENFQTDGRTETFRTDGNFFGQTENFGRTDGQQIFGRTANFRMDGKFSDALTDRVHGGLQQTQKKVPVLKNCPFWSSCAFLDVTGRIVVENQCLLSFFVSVRPLAER